MIYLIFMLLVLLMLFGVGYIPFKFSYSFMSFEHTNILRGIAALIIMLQHYAGGNGVRYLTPLGGTGVAIFLILSGFGLNESYKKNRNINKLDSNTIQITKYWHKKILKVFLPYAIFESAMIIIFRLDNTSLIEWILDVICIEPAYWYLQIILISYISFYICSLNDYIYKYKYYILVFIGLLLFLFGNEIRAEQAISFIMGVLISDNKSSVKNLILKNRFVIITFVIGIFLLCLKQMPIIRNFYDSYIWYILQLLMKMALALGFISLTGKFNHFFNNRFLLFMGNISYQFYLVHYAALSMLNLPANRILISILFLIISIVGAWLFKFIWEKVMVLLK